MSFKSWEVFELALIINIDKKKIPYRFEILLAGSLFEMEFHYNPDFNYFTVDLFKNKELIVFGEKLVYGLPLFHDIVDSRLPDVGLIPLDASGQTVEVNAQTLGETVFLTVVEWEMAYG
ncbi:hypothetical protein SAMN03159341_103192 [Paenibacillus sp. 1_12]|uniref:phage baseplate plug family protein n=1 Tax=Paenibacillus sp. 1_12 TaxID=1566278 RepID=UPI0008E2320E|nr:hypothetical protein [Paenibacillus sp. 1_12]SFL09740.1 hypothetical protein SAMN03159341_103192 [Paenibacillus sp. 1_12]